MNPRLKATLIGLLASVPAFGQTSGTASLDRGFALAPFWEAARTGRADVVLIGDSNILFQGNGWEAGWIRVASDRFGIYATGVMSAGSGDGNGIGEGEGYASVSLASSHDFLFSGAPAFFNDFVRSPLSTIRYAYVPQGKTTSKNGTTGMVLAADGPIDVNAALRLHMVLGEFADPESASRRNPTFRLATGGVRGPQMPRPVDESLPEGTSPPPPLTRRLDTNAPRFERGGTPDEPIAGAGGWFTPMCRLDQPPYSTLMNFPTYSTLAPVNRLTRRTFDLPARVRNKNVAFRWYPFGGPAISGPFLTLYQRIEQVERTHGIAISTLAPMGGKDARDMALALINSDNRTLSRYFEEVRALQGPRKHVLVRICTGLNDRSEKDWAVGPIPTLGSGPDAYKSNIMAIMNRVQDIWTLNGWPATELFFLLTPSHPVSDPDDPKLISYRVAAQQVAALYPRTAAVRLDQLTNEAEMLAKVFYNPPPPQYPEWGFDHNHLTLTGTTTLAGREIDFLLSKSCATDWTGDGVSDAADLAAFMMEYSANSLKADFNQDGFIGADDLAAFLAAMESNCH